MPRPLKGTIEKRASGWAARVTLADGSRTYFDLPSGLTEQRARELAAMLAADAREGKLRKVAPPAPAPVEAETVAQYATRWLDERERRGHRAVRDDRGRIVNWVLPTLGSRSLSAVTPSDLRALVASLDQAALDRRLHWKTTSCVWALVTKMFSDAVESKSGALRVLSTNPTIGVRGPDRGGHKAKSWLFPAEALALLASDRVALHWRRIFALAIYTYARAGELEALDWSDVDLDHGTLHVHRQCDANDGSVVPTKTKVTRRVPLEPALLPLLRAMREESRGVGRVIPKMPSRELGAPTLRAGLRAAGITREELFADDETRKPLTFHDLRATGITWCAVRGDDPLKIQRRAGHTGFATTQGYIREAEVLDRELFGSPFPPLPLALLASSVPRVSSAESSAPAGENVSTASPMRNSSRPQRDSKPLTATDRGGSRDKTEDLAAGVEPVTTHSDGVSSAPTIPPTIQDRPVTPRPDAVLDHLAACETLRLIEADEDLQWLLEPPLGGVVQ